MQLSPDTFTVVATTQKLVKGKTLGQFNVTPIGKLKLRGYWHCSALMVNNPLSIIIAEAHKYAHTTGCILHNAFAPGLQAFLWTVIPASAAGYLMGATPAWKTKI